jgi:hypothetical protein
MLPLPDYAWDAYYLALTWRAHCKIPATIVENLEQLGIDMTDTRRMNESSSEDEDEPAAPKAPPTALKPATSNDSLAASN